MEDQSTTHSQKAKLSAHNDAPTLLIAGVILLIIVAVGAFAGGVQYQKSHGTTRASVLSGQFSTNGPGGFARDGSFGAVTAISANSITVSDQRSGSTKTYVIDGSSKLTNNGTTIAYSDVQVGDRVIIRTSGSTSTTATTIDVNPSFQGDRGGQADTGTGTSSQGSQSSSSDSSI